MPLSACAKSVARIPALYELVGSTMSLATWSLTRRQNRTPTLARIPPGKLSASGRCVSSSRITPSAGPRLTIALTSASNSFPNDWWLNASWHSLMMSASGYGPGCAWRRARA